MTFAVIMFDVAERHLQYVQSMQSKYQQTPLPVQPRYTNATPRPIFETHFWRYAEPNPPLKKQKKRTSTQAKASSPPAAC